MKTYLLAFMLGVFATLLMVRYVGPSVVKFAPTVQAQDIPLRGRACAAALLAGGYAFTLEGDILSGNNEGPYAGLGVLTLDGLGNASLTIGQNYNGVVTAALTTVGRYNLGDDCVGALVFNNGARFDIVANNTGREINLMQLVSGSVIRGVAKKQ